LDCRRFRLAGSNHTSSASRSSCNRLSRRKTPVIDPTHSASSFFLYLQSLRPRAPTPPYIARRRLASRSAGYLFHVPLGIRCFCVAAVPPIARHYRAMKVQMNNRDQQSTRPVQQPLVPTAITYLHVFTVAEYESNGKSGKHRTKIGAAFPHKEGSGFSIELCAIPLDGRLVVLPPDGNEDNHSK
jgi:hypothetical protein